MNYNRYIKNCFNFKKLLLEKSEEYYFGENNSLKTRLIENINYIRSIVSDAKSKKVSFKPADILPDLRKAIEPLKQTIIEEFNIEDCFIGWENTMNAACYIQIANADIWGKDKNAKDLRIRLDDVVTTSPKGFKYKKSKGIFYCTILGYPIFAVDTFFTTEEAAAILCHELGHAMQHMVTSLNESVAVQQFEILLNYYEPKLSMLTEEDKKYVMSYMKRFRNAIKKGDKEELKNLGDSVLNELNPKEGKGFSTYTDQYIEDEASKNNPSWNVDTETAYDRAMKRKPGPISSFIKGLFKGVFSLAFFWVWIPSIIAANKRLKDKNNEEHIYKVFEETADNFAQIYGLGPNLATAIKKLNTISEKYNRSGPSFIERIPMLDLIDSFNEMNMDRHSCIYGYPTNKQRAINLYKSAKFELDHNKDLSPEYKKELENQLENYKTVYEEFVNNDKTKGWFYKLITGINKETLEQACKNDKNVDKHVLEPLQEKADPNFKNDVYDN